jgi:hypothetical protein
MFTPWLQDARRRAFMRKDYPAVAHYEMQAIQPIDFMESTCTPEEYRGHLKCCVIKYISRYQRKGTPLKDLHKALTYLEWLIAFEDDGERGKPNG